MLYADRPLPSRPELELEIVGALMLFPTCAYAVREFLPDPAAFHDLKVGQCYRAALEVIAANGEPDPITLQAHGADKAAAMRCADAAVTSAGVEHKAELVRDCWLARRAIDQCHETLGKLFDTGSDAPTRDLIGQAASGLAVLADTGAPATAQLLGAGMDDTMRYLDALNTQEQYSDGYPCGFAELSELMPLRPGELIIFAARPAVGKTALALQVAVYLSRLPEPIGVGFFSLEMSTALLRRRALMQLARVSPALIRSAVLPPNRWQDMAEAAQLLPSLPIWVDDSSRRTVQDIATGARRLQRDHAVGAVIVDYLQLVKPARNRNNRESEVAEVSAGLKAIAKELRVPLIVLAQLNRQAEESPKVSHLRESGAIEADADLIALMWVRVDNGETREVEVIVAKHRNGPTGKRSLMFFPGETRFADRERGQE